MKPKPWEKRSSKLLGDYRIFCLRSDVKVSPLTGKEHDFYVIEATNWVNVVPVTRDGKIIMVEQYRHGSNTVELEIPGGMIDAEDADPVAAAVRELREETGYEGHNARLIGQVFPNPAIMNNICFTVLVEDCQLKHDVKFDQTEDIAVTLVDQAEIPELVRAGRIGHSLVVVALYHYELQRRPTPKAGPRSPSAPSVPPPFKSEGPISRK
jgi:ADP-ribose pyrophosphatase